MKKTLIKAVVIGATLAVVGAFAAGPAGATPPSGYGYDDTAHVIVGGGSDTTYYAQQQLTTMYDHSDFGTSGGCLNVTSVGPSLNECSGDVTYDLGNYQHDTVGQANPVGSSSGVASLNGFTNGGSSVCYGGTVNPVPGATFTCPNVDFARSSRAKTSGGDINGGNELVSPGGDAFWGFAEDGIQVTVFGARGPELQSVGGSALTPQDLFEIWNCSVPATGGDPANYWADVTDLNITPGSSSDGPIVPWGVNTASGTFATFQTYIQNHASGVPSGWSPNGQSCDMDLSNTAGTPFPQENDMKPLINNPTTIGTTNTDPNNPVNWIVWGSYGVMSTFPFLSAPVRGGVTYQTYPAPVNGVLPSTSNILANTWAIGRTLWHVTRQADATCPTSGSACDFTDNLGPTLPGGSGNDLNVTTTALGNAGGNSTGVSGAIREYTRWLCRVSATQQQPDPFTGVNYFSEITSAIASSGFTVVPVGLRSGGSRCDVVQ